MSKKNKQKNTAKTATTETIKVPQSINSTILQWNKYFLIILTAISVLYYANSYNNKYCLDDIMCITSNSMVQKGFGGIPELLTTDFLHGYRNSESSDAASSRWRPFTLITYAIEIAIFGSNKPNISHGINIALYALLIIILYLFLSKYIFKNIYLAFFTSLLFAIHPIHTEVVANIKSRDEIFCMLLGVASLYYLWNYLAESKITQLIFSLALFFLSLTAKENTITFLALIPVMLYFFEDYSFSKIAKITAYFVGTIVLWALIRNTIVPFVKLEGSAEILNNPYLLATKEQNWATVIYLLLYDLKFLILPWPLCCDYSYNHFPYVDFSFWGVWLSLAVHIALAVIALYFLKRKNIFAFCILWYAIIFSISTNIVIEIGTPLAERLLFMPSLAICIAIVFAIKYIFEKLNLNNKNQMIASIAISLVFILLTFPIVFERNKNWSNDINLYMADYPKAKNNCRMSNGAAGAYLNLNSDTTYNQNTRDSFAKLAVKILDNAIAIHPTFDDAHLNLGVAYNRLKDVNLTEKNWAYVQQHAPGHPKLKEYMPVLSNMFYVKGSQIGSKNYDSCIYYFEKATYYDPKNVNAWYDLGGSAFMNKNYEKCINALQKCLALNPNKKEAQQGLAAATMLLKQNP